MFGHEKFIAYQHSIKFVSIITPLLTNLPKGNSHLIDQLKRASISIPLNIAEGSGKTTKKDKRRFYSIARGSTMECAAVLDVICCSKIVDKKEIYEAKKLLNEIASILSKVCLR